MDVERPLPGSETSIGTRIASIFAGRPSRARSRAANSRPKNPKEVLRGEMFSPGISNYTMVDFPLLSLGDRLALRRFDAAFSESLRDLLFSSCYNPVLKWQEDFLSPMFSSSGLEPSLQTYWRLSNFCELDEVDVGNAWLGNYEYRCDICGPYPKYSSVDSPCWQDFYSTPSTVNILIFNMLGWPGSGACVRTFLVLEVGPE